MEKDILKPVGEINEKSTYICGLDPSRTGKDETALVILEKLPFGEDIFVSYIEIINTTKLDIVIARVIFLDKIYNFKKIIIDETGVGGGPTDILKAQLGYRVEGVWYTAKIKAEMFNNLKILMMRKTGKLYIPDYLEMRSSIVKKMYYQFLSITQEYKNDDATRVPKISHEARSHDDIVNAIALAATFFNIKNNRTRTYGFGGFNVTK